ncbi:MAG: hypothetical protein IJW86_06825 [Clostridia bacterium]|nr:hypothetical protein [Clostridia bacterium]
MKKFLSLLLIVFMTFSLTLPAYAGWSNSQSQIPVILISGDGDSIYDAQGNEVFRFSKIMSMFTSVEDGDLKQSVLNVIQPMLLEGLAKDDWDSFYENLEKEIGEIFEKCRLDSNGEVSDGSGISQQRKDYMANARVTDAREGKGYYGLYDYRFWYDWRLDPMAIADEFNAYIKDIKKATGAPKVAIVARCLGTSVVMAYIAKYGLDDIHGIGFNGTVANGAEILSETISGKFSVDGRAVSRLLKDVNALGWVNLDSFITSTIDLAVESGIVDGAIDTIEALLYEKLVVGMTSALALSTFYTWPSYWSAVTVEDYDTAIQYVFGSEGSEKRIQYAGLIKKLNNYHETVRKNVPDLYRNIKQNGVNVGAISKYGYQIVPIIESNSAVADQFASVTRSSFGATTSTVYDTLSDEYIAARIAEGKGRYISPDKQIDASTCIYPDYTWFTKGSSHSNWSLCENNIMHIVATADRQLTIDDFEYTQFMVYNSSTGLMVPMTEDNCNVTNWQAEKPDTLLGKIRQFIETFKNWFNELIALLKAKIEASSNK